jgi:integrase
MPTPSILESQPTVSPSETTPALPHQHTFGHIDCPACEATRTDTLSNDPDSLLQQKFSLAAGNWLATRQPYLKPPTYALYDHHISQLAKFFGQLTIQKIHLGHLREYQRSRLANSILLLDGNRVQPWKKKAGASLINHELCVVQQVLKRAGAWQRFGVHYEPLPLPSFQPNKVMTDKEEDRLFDIASKNPDFELAYWVAAITANTTAAGCELRHLRHRDVHLELQPPRICVRADMAKNEYRGRVIPLNATALEMVAKCLARAKKLGSHLPDQYVFPSRICRNAWDPDKPASESWLKKSFKALREEAGLPWLKPHCLRHQAITRMLELGVPEETVRSVAGHVSAQMMRHYAHTRIAMQSAELDKIDPRHRKPASRSVSRRGAVEMSA